ncbi:MULTISPECIES: DUF7673 family protein [Sphingobium]|uniref:DUF7673 domain-containing protein n=1 Tax=Sphingobium baderi TaxID=1332080 RepID=A0A0S3F572_9SPHN|nr:MULTISPECIES: hypothetical protein [Sphingobium]ALR22819.1 hypothetical protein ATN00_20120 [Sphingobium baderi]PHP17496.1 hypothetical protein CG471_22535 [Sphingobium sp. IP1]
MDTLKIDHKSADEALRRLIAVALSDTGQSRRVANFLLAWWNGDDWGHFEISDIFAMDQSIGVDIATIVGYLAAYPGAVYPDAFGYRDAMVQLIEIWRSDAVTSA